MRILSYNPGHDGAFAYVEDGRLLFSMRPKRIQSTEILRYLSPMHSMHLPNFMSFPTCCAKGAGGPATFQAKRRQWPTTAAPIAIR